MGIGNRGSALLEALPTLSIMILFVSTLLIAAFIIFARVWIEYQAEQALYCQAEAAAAAGCRTALSGRLEAFLPGQIEARCWQTPSEGLVQIVWRYRGWHFRVQKSLSSRSILKNRALL